MANGDKAGLSLDGSSLLVNTVKVSTVDIQASNGVIHVLDAVLMPPADMGTPTNNIIETAVAAGSFCENRLRYPRGFRCGYPSANRCVSTARY